MANVTNNIIMFGDSNIKTIMLGNSSIKAIYLGETKLYDNN